MKNKGFTLIELLVVIAIIGILSSVVLTSLNTARQKARDAKRIAEVGQIKLALEQYFDSCGAYPDAPLSVGTNNDCPEGSSTTFGSFITTIPKPPSGAAGDYGYLPNATGTDFCLGAELEDEYHISIQTQCDLEGYNHTVKP